MIQGEPVYGDDETSRDYSYIDNAMEAKHFAAMCGKAKAGDQMYNIVVDKCASLNGQYAG